MNSPDGPEQRTAELEERIAERNSDLDELLAADDDDFVMSETEQIEELKARFKDIAFGAEMMLPFTSGAFRSYVAEVKRVAEAPL